MSKECLSHGHGTAFADGSVGVYHRPWMTYQTLAARSMPHTVCMQRFFCASCSVALPRPAHPCAASLIAIGSPPDCISQLLEMRASLWAPPLSLLTCVGAGSRALFYLQSFVRSTSQTWSRRWRHWVSNRVNPPSLMPPLVLSIHYSPETENQGHSGRSQVTCSTRTAKQKQAKILLLGTCRASET